MLTHNIRQYPIPDEEKEIYLRLASKFQEKTEYLYYSYEELPDATQIGAQSHWQAFLQLEPVQVYIKAQMAEATRVAQRKALLALQKEAELGTVAAAREINELSGIMKKQQEQRTIILHYIERD